MDELAKTEARNYLCAAGFFMLAAWFILRVFFSAGATAYVTTTDSIHLVVGIGLIVVATLLIVLHKRDMIAILFFLMGFLQLFFAFTTAGIWDAILSGFVLLAALVTLSGQDKKKWQLFLIPLFFFIHCLIKEAIGYNMYEYIAMYAILAVVSLYYAFCCASERISFQVRSF